MFQVRNILEYACWIVAMGGIAETSLSFLENLGPNNTHKQVKLRFTKTTRMGSIKDCFITQDWNEHFEGW